MRDYKPKLCKLKDGCPGCGKLWNAPGSEGQCSRCNRCLECCGDGRVQHSCADKHYWKVASNPGYAARSAAAYDRWENNPNILSHNRRIY